jgi:hypothetical protein
MWHGNHLPAIAMAGEAPFMVSQPGFFILLRSGSKQLRVK